MAASQAVSDLLLGLFITPMEVIHHVLPEANVNEYICLAHQISILLFPLVSTFHLMFVALERFLKVVHPLQASKVAVKSKVKVIIGFCWILPSVFAMFSFLGWNRLREEKLRYGSTVSFTPHYKYVYQTPCSRLEHLHCSYISLLLTMILSMYIGVAAMYFQVVVVARRKVEQAAMASDCDMREEVKILYILLWSASYFVISWCPLTSVVSVECLYAPTPDILWVLTLVFANCNSVISPIVYGYGNRNIREFVSTKIRGNRSRVTPLHPRQSGERTVLTEKTKKDGTDYDILTF
ncbi:adenosine receptor A1-like [Mizuhopecten yessoensis]|nr:adenosine receptor A1-like [Mizuhopecten yessoensis]